MDEINWLIPKLHSPNGFLFGPPSTKFHQNLFPVAFSMEKCGFKNRQP
jgi:hypothetical protein